MNEEKQPSTTLVFPPKESDDDQTSTSSLDPLPSEGKDHQRVTINVENSISTQSLNPDAPDFTPTDFTGKSSQRRSTIADHYNIRSARTRVYSDTYQQASDSNTLIPALPSLMPELNQSTGLISTIYSRSPEDYRRRSHTASGSSYQSRGAYPSYAPLMQATPLIDEKSYPSTRPLGSQRPRAYSGRNFLTPDSLKDTRQRSHSGPGSQTISAPPNHLTGIHSLTRIMIDILRLIPPVTTIHEESQSSNSVGQGHQQSGDNALQVKEDLDEATAAENITGTCFFLRLFA